MICSDIIKVLENLSPSKYALDWDNVGLLVGRTSRDIKKVVVSLDCDTETVDFSISKQADMIITHHPIIFGSLKSVNDSYSQGDKILKIIENGICEYSMHTNFDVCVMGSLAGKMLDLTNMSPLDVTHIDENGNKMGVGVVGECDGNHNAAWWCNKVKEVFGLPYVSFFGNADDIIDKIAICPGSGKEFALQAKALGAKILITGDINHHSGLDAVEENMNICDATHFGIEYIFVDYISKYLKECFGDGIEVVPMPKHFPYKIY